MSPGPHTLSSTEVVERFRWARRRGAPAWLWPEVSPRAWREALLQIEFCVRVVLANDDAIIPLLDGDPQAIGLAGYTSGVGPLLGLWIETGRLTASPAAASILALHLSHCRQRAERMQVAGERLIRALATAGVDTVVLKGAHTGPAYFPEHGVRPASDIDLLVNRADLGRAEAVLAAEGYELASRAQRESSWRIVGAAQHPRSLTHVHADEAWTVDLHESLDLFVSAGAPLAELDRLQPMAGRTPWALGPGAFALDQPLLLLHLAVHAGAGLQNLTLLRLVELVLVIRQDEARGVLSWQAFADAGRRASSLGYAYPALCLAGTLAPGLVPQEVLDACAGAAPAGVRRVVASLTPGTAQRIDRTSVAEHFMWTSGLYARARQILADLAPAAGSWAGVWSIYEKRAWRLLRGRISP